MLIDGMLWALCSILGQLFRCDDCRAGVHPFVSGGMHACSPLNQLFIKITCCQREHL